MLKGFKTQITVTNGLGRDRIDEAVLVQRYLKEVGIEAELKIQEHGRIRPRRCRASSRDW